MKIVFPILALLLTGCAATTTIAPYGKDTFVLSVADTMGTSQRSELRVKAAQDANAHCAKLGKEMSVQSAEDKGVAWLTSTSSQLVFTCK